MSVVAMDDREVEPHAEHDLSGFVLQLGQFRIGLLLRLGHPGLRLGHSLFEPDEFGRVSRPYPSTRIGPATNNATR